jgi:NADH:ubiquinone oxidoreductase subunit 5 (subunit L)/multisubunit Na+/H+ antiporter MnhA subunit
MLIASLSLVAFPFMTGFYSKDFILESAFGQFYFSSIVVYVIAVIGAIFTTLYSVKVLYLTFLTNPNGPLVNYIIDKQVLDQSKSTYNMLLLYNKKLYQLGWHAGGAKVGYPWHFIDPVYEDLVEKIKGMNSYFAINPNQFKVIFEEINTKLWPIMFYPIRGYFSEESLKNNYLTDMQKSLNIAIDRYTVDFQNSCKLTKEGDLFLSLPLVILAIFSIFFGYITKDIFIGLGSSFFIDNSIFIHPVHEIMLDTEFAVPVLFKLLPLIFTITFSILALIFSEFLPESLINFKFSKLGYNIFGFFNQRFLVEMIYNKYITNLVLRLGGQTTKVLDKGSIELLGPWGLELGLIKLSKNISSLSTGIVTTYALFILIGLITYILVWYFTLANFDLVLLLVLGVFYFYLLKGTVMFGNRLRRNENENENET